MVFATPALFFWRGVVHLPPAACFHPNKPKLESSPMAFEFWKVFKALVGGLIIGWALRFGGKGVPTVNTSSGVLQVWSIQTSGLQPRAQGTLNAGQPSPPPSPSIQFFHQIFIVHLHFYYKGKSSSFSLFPQWSDASGSALVRPCLARVVFLFAHGSLTFMKFSM